MISCLLLSACVEPPARHNVVLVVIDTLRADHLGIYGYQRATSPHLDGWAERAVVFERAMATSPWTLPTFGSILTGLMPAAHGAGLDVVGTRELYARSKLDPDVETLAERLAGADWTTGAIVGNPFLKRRFGVGQGFETYDVYQGAETARDVTDRALEWIGAREQEPFFLLVHYMDPHLPYRAPEPARGRFSGDTEKVRMPILPELRARAAEFSPVERAYFVARYDEEIAFLDLHLDRLFEGLEARWSDTIVVLTADHGEEILDHGGFDHGHTMMQELLHVPLLIWAPELEARRESAVVSLADIAPTLLEALSLQEAEEDSPGPLEGRSLWAALSARTSLPAREVIAESILYGTERKALFDWPYKLVVAETGSRRRLVDLAADPEETNDLAPTRPQVANRLEERLRRYVAAAPRDLNLEAVHIDGRTARELEALGYVD